MIEPLQIIFKLPFTILRDLVIIPDLNTIDHDSPTGKGYQKPLMYPNSRAPDIGKYYVNGGPVTPLTLSCRDVELYDDIQEIVLYNHPFQEQPQWEKLTKLVGKHGLRMIDGQNRFTGLCWVYDDYKIDLLVPAFIVFGLSLSEEARLFNDINMEFKKMGKADKSFLKYFEPKTPTTEDQKEKPMTEDDTVLEEPDHVEEESLTERTIWLRSISTQLTTDSGSLKGCVAHGYIDWTRGHVMSLDHLHYFLSSMFPPMIMDMFDSKSAYEMANNFFIKLKEALGLNWGSRYVMIGDQYILRKDGYYSKSKVHQISTIAGLCFNAYRISVLPETTQKKVYQKISMIHWDSPDLDYGPGKEGVIAARNTFRDILFKSTVRVS